MTVDPQGDRSGWTAGCVDAGACAAAIISGMAGAIGWYGASNPRHVPWIVGGVLAAIVVGGIALSRSSARKPAGPGKPNRKERRARAVRARRGIV